MVEVRKYHTRSTVERGVAGFGLNHEPKLPKKLWDVIKGNPELKGKMEAVRQEIRKTAVENAWSPKFEGLLDEAEKLGFKDAVVQNVKTLNKPPALKKRVDDETAYFMFTLYKRASPLKRGKALGEAEGEAPKGREITLSARHLLELFDVHRQDYLTKLGRRAEVVASDHVNPLLIHVHNLHLTKIADEAHDESKRLTQELTKAKEEAQKAGSTIDVKEEELFEAIRESAHEQYQHRRALEEKEAEISDYKQMLEHHRDLAQHVGEQLENAEARAKQAAELTEKYGRIGGKRRGRIVMLHDVVRSHAKNFHVLSKRLEDEQQLSTVLEESMKKAEARAGEAEEAFEKGERVKGEWRGYIEKLHRKVRGRDRNIGELAAKLKREKELRKALKEEARKRRKEAAEEEEEEEPAAGGAAPSSTINVSPTINVSGGSGGAGGAGAGGSGAPGGGGAGGGKGTAPVFTTSSTGVSTAARKEEGVAAGEEEKKPAAKKSGVSWVAGKGWGGGETNTKWLMIAAAAAAAIFILLTIFGSL